MQGYVTWALKPCSGVPSGAEKIYKTLLVAEDVCHRNLLCLHQLPLRVCVHSLDS
jgi:hypothetical protein